MTITNHFYNFTSDLFFDQLLESSVKCRMKESKLEQNFDQDLFQLEKFCLQYLVNLIFTQISWPVLHPDTRVDWPRIWIIFPRINVCRTLFAEVEACVNVSDSENYVNMICWSWERQDQVGLMKDNLPQGIWGFKL